MQCTIKQGFIIAIMVQNFFTVYAQLPCVTWSESIANNNIPWAATVNTNSSIIPRTIAAIIVNPSLVLANANRFLDQNGQIHLEELSSFTVSANITVFGETHVVNENIQTIQVSEVRIHPEFNKLNWTLAENDIAAVHLKTPLKFDISVNAVCIPTEKILKTIYQESLDDHTRKDHPVAITGWNRYMQKPKTIILSVDMRNNTFCKHWWETNEETSHAPYVKRYCAFVSKDNPNEYCIHKDNGIIGKWENRVYFLGFVNNFYSDGGICNSKTLYFGAAMDETILRFINNNII